MDPGNGFVSSVWGPSLWFVLHCISMNYPIAPTDHDKRVYRRWFEGLGDVLPCDVCRSNFQTNLRDINYSPETAFDSRPAFALLVYKLHNRIREMSGKPTSMTYTECVLFYEQFRARTCGARDRGDQEGGCQSTVPLVSTITVSDESDSEHARDHCRYRIDQNCSLHTEISK